MRKVVWLIALVMLLATGAKAQLQTHVSARLDRIPVNLTGSQLTLILSGLQPGSDWIVGVQSNEGDQGSRLTVAEVLYSTAVSGMAEMPSQIASWPPSQVSLSPGIVQIGGLGNLKGKLFIFLSMPASAKVRVVASGGAGTDLTVTPGVMIRRGQVLPESVQSLPSVLAMLQTPFGQAQQDLLPMPNGLLLASFGALKRNLVKFQMPASPGPTQTSGADTVFATLRLEIDDKGQVQGVSTIAGDPAFAATCQEAVRSWKFIPFVSNGKPLSVLAVISFAVDQTGKVSSSITG